MACRPRLRPAPSRGAGRGAGAAPRWRPVLPGSSPDPPVRAASSRVGHCPASCASSRGARRANPSRRDRDPRRRGGSGLDNALLCHPGQASDPPAAPGRPRRSVECGPPSPRRAARDRARLRVRRRMRREARARAARSGVFQMRASPSGPGSRSRRGARWRPAGRARSSGTRPSSPPRAPKRRPMRRRRAPRPPGGS
jgi:hypothetical protein